MPTATAVAIAATIGNTYALLNAETIDEADYYAGSMLAGAATGSRGLRAIKPPATGEGPIEYCHRADLIRTHGQTRSNRKMRQLMEDIRRDGITEPLDVVELDGDLYVVTGNHRHIAAGGVGIQSLPIRRVQLPYRGYASAEDLFTGRPW